MKSVQRKQQCFHDRLFNLSLIGFVVFLLSIPLNIHAAPYMLTTIANNGSISVNPEKSLYDEGEKVELIPRPNTGFSFSGWSGDVQGKRLVLNPDYAFELVNSCNGSITRRFHKSTIGQKSEVRI